MMESGPVAGMIGAGRLAALLGIERAIGFDMGGTTAKASLITNGVPAIEDGYVIGGEASGQPMQIAGGRHRRDRRRRRLDRLVRSRPAASMSGRRARAPIPGPACYGKGSTDPVVTDANLVLGRINAERFLNGAMKLDRAAAERAIEPKLAGRLRPRRDGSRARHRADRRRRHVARGARGVGQEGRRSARDRDDRVRRRRAAACGRDRAGDFHPEGDRAEGAGHVLGARHADGVVAAGFRAHAATACSARSTRRQVEARVRRAGRGRQGPGRARRHRAEHRRLRLSRRPALCRPGAHHRRSRCATRSC